MQTALILALVAALFWVWAWLSLKFSRFGLGLYDANCPHCRAANTLDVADKPGWEDFYLFPPTDSQDTLLVCCQCKKTSSFSEVFPLETSAPDPPAAA